MVAPTMAPTPTPAWSADSPCKPSFMVIGAPKCGSTSLFGYLEAHPQVQQPAQKELCYFSAFKRHLQRNRTNRASSNWELYQAGLAGRASHRAALRTLGLMAFGTRRRPLSEEGSSPITTNSSGSRWQESTAAKTAAAQCVAGEKHAFEGCPFYLGEVMGRSGLGCGMTPCHQTHHATRPTTVINFTLAWFRCARP